MNLELTSESVPIDTPSIDRAKRFELIVEYATGVCVPCEVAELPEDAVEAFMVQAPGRREGESSLFDHDEQRVVARVKWKTGATEIGLCVLHRQNVFHDWHLALLACEVQKRLAVQATVERLA